MKDVSLFTRVAAVALSVSCALVACTDERPEAVGKARAAVTPVTLAAVDLELKVQTASCGERSVDEVFEITNHGSVAVPLSDLSIGLWANESSAALRTAVSFGGCLQLPGEPGNGCHHPVHDVSSAAQAFSPACGPTPGQQANWEVTVSTSDGRTLPPGATWSGIRASVYLQGPHDFSPGTATWYSGCLPAGGALADASAFALYDAGQLVRSATGVPPSCRAATGSQVLQGEVPSSLIAASTLVGGLPGATQVTLAIGLPLQTAGAPGSGYPPLDTLLQEITAPNSTVPGLTSAQFAAAYGPADADYGALQQFATSNGLTVSQTFQTKSILVVTGSAAAVEQAFAVTLNVYQKSDGTQFYAPANDPSVNLGVSLQHVSGFDSATTIRRKGGTSHTACAPTPSPIALPNEYFGQDIRNAYLSGCTPSTLEGQGQTIALIEFSGYYPADILKYANVDSTVGNGTQLDAPGLPGTLSNIQQRKIDVQISPFVGFADPCVSPNVDSSETVLDIDVLLAVAPQANILVYETHIQNQFQAQIPPEVILQLAADDDLAQVISDSVSWNTATPDPNIAPIFVQYAAQRQSFFAAAGDTGALVPVSPYDASVSNSLQHITAGVPIVNTSLMTVVGGTELQTTGINGMLGMRAFETTWNDVTGGNGRSIDLQSGLLSGSVTTGGFLSGDGVNPAVPLPDYQVGVNTMNPEITGGPPNTRMIPDVSWLADGLGLWLTDVNSAVQSSMCVGGTSAAAPMWAGLAALVNQQRATPQVNLPPLGFANPALYMAATMSASNYNDINDGSNNNWYDDGGMTESATLSIPGAAKPMVSESGASYHAQNGYDLATGLGTPTCSLLTTLVNLPNVCPTTCNGNCVDLTSDPSNCGGCGQSCGGGKCINGICGTLTVGLTTDSMMDATNGLLVFCIVGTGYDEGSTIHVDFEGTSTCPGILGLDGLGRDGVVTGNGGQWAYSGVFTYSSCCTIQEQLGLENVTVTVRDVGSTTPAIHPQFTLPSNYFCLDASMSKPSLMNLNGGANLGTCASPDGTLGLFFGD